MHLKAFKASYPKLDGLKNPSLFFDSIKVRYNSLRKQGQYLTLPTPSIYLHQILKDGKSFRGIVACIDLEDYLKGHIIPHEKTITALEEKQIRLLQKTRAQLKPIMLAHRKTERLQPLLQEVVAQHPHFLEVQFDELGELHRYWQVPQGRLTEEILDVYGHQVPSVYVADGHHRLAANATMFQNLGAEHRWMPAALYEEDQLHIFEFNRIVKGLNGLTPLAFMARLSSVAEITPLPQAAKPSKTGELTMFLKGEWFRLSWRGASSHAQSAAPRLDVDLLNSQVLEGVLGITDIRNARRVQYLQGTIPLEQILESLSWNKNQVLFCLPSIDLKTFFEISDRRQTLPPKSTWFEPRIRSGLLVRRFD